MSAIPAEESAQNGRSRLAANLTIAALFGLFIAYDVWEAIGNLVGIVGYANDLRIGIVGWGWLVLVGAVILPALLWIVATVLGWKRTISQKIALQILALAVSAASYLSIITMFNDTNLFVLS